MNDTSNWKFASAIATTYSAKMQTHDWNDIKYLLALHREGRLTETGRTLGVSDTTVARRIKALEASLEITLFLRSAVGRYEPTDAALQVLAHAETIEAENAAIRAVAGENAHRVTGRVRISSVPIVVNRFLVPRIASLERLHPNLAIELVPTSGNVDLSKREADLAVRFARPVGGGLRTKAKKLGQLAFAAYAASSISPDQCENLKWIAYDDTHSGLPQARWLDHAASSSEQRTTLRVADAETAMQAVAEAIGKTLLPRAIACRDPRFREIEVEGSAKYPSREVWLLSHVDQTSRMSISAAKDWLTGLDWV